MRMLDLFCGRFGWSKAFAARGWHCVGIDLVAPPVVPENCECLKLDILNLTAEFIKCGNFDFICASSPCEQFSVHGLKCFHKNPPYPELGIQLFNHTRSICEASGVPYVMENVRVAQEFVGRSVHHAGPFHLWGNAVPPLLPCGIYKECRMLPGNRRTKLLNAGMELRTNRTIYQRAFNDESGGRKAGIARSATIPEELSTCVAEYAGRLLEQRREPCQSSQTSL